MAQIEKFKGNLQLAGKIPKIHGTLVSSDTTDVVRKNKTQNLHNEQDFIVTKKNLLKNGEPNECMFGSKNHCIFKMP